MSVTKSHKGQYITPLKGNTHQAVLGCKGNWMTVHIKRTQVTLHYCSLLFHCLISQRLIYVHAFPGITHDKGIPSIKCRCKLMHLGHFWNQCATEKGKWGMFQWEKTSNAPAVPGNADIRDSEGEGMNLISVPHAFHGSPCLMFKWQSVLNISSGLDMLFGGCRVIFDLDGSTINECATKWYHQDKNVPIQPRICLSFSMFYKRVMQN